jgi:hypothetical protein
VSRTILKVSKINSRFNNYGPDTLAWSGAILGPPSWVEIGIRVKKSKIDVS